MKNKNISGNILSKLLDFQKSELTEYYIYSKLAKTIKNKQNSSVLQNIANDELKHNKILAKITETELKPDKWKIFKFYWISKVLGLTFGIKVMERGENQAQINYKVLIKTVPQIKKIINDENIHEKKLINMIEEEKLNYIGSIVLGLNDALVELTGALAGLTFALQNTRLIALTGLITGIAASFSMAASEYLSIKSEGDKGQNALKSSIYTGIAYIFTVFLLIFPYLLLKQYFICLGLTLIIALLIILFFNLYLSVAKDYSFKKRFFEMAFLSLGIAALSFGIGIIIRKVLGVEI